MAKDNLMELLEFATSLAERAGEITLKYYRTNLAVENKADQSPVTIADRESETFLRAEIEKRYPDDGLVGEEFGVKEGRSGRRWIFDPIDGTKTFIRGVPLYGTMLAVEIDGEARIGVICYPATGETLAAAIGHGCFYNGERCSVSRTSDLEKATGLTTDLAHFNQYLGAGALSRYIGKLGLIRTWGDCYGYLLLATGRADVMVDPIMNPWDVAATLPIVKEAGGMISDLSGACSVDISPVVATNGLLHEQVIQLLKA